MEVPRHWRLKKQRYRLVGEECPHCEVKIFPPRDICPECNHGTLNNNLDMFVRNDLIEANRVKSELERRQAIPTEKI